MRNEGDGGERSYLELRRVAKVLGGKRVLDEVSLEVAKGDLLGMLGPSGSGKTTMLNIIGGFLAPDEGAVRIAGEDILGLQPHRRDIGITFQGYALFPHLSVFDNVAYGLKQRRIAKAEIRDRAMKMLEILGLGGLDDRFPKALSGGEQQRVALARALVVRPRLMLLDEPLANLDASLRQRVRFEIREVLRRTQVTSIFVTHDQDEAFALCDRVAVLNKGRIQQIGTPPELVGRPANAFVAGFIGCPNVFRATVIGYDAAREEARIEINGFAASVTCRSPVKIGASVTVFVRPEEVSFDVQPTNSSESSLFRVKDWIYLGSGREVWVEGPLPLRGRVPNDAQPLERGAPVWPCWRVAQAHAFEDEAPTSAQATPARIATATGPLARRAG
jgi:putative spermidine/putrescine transport system ATP-binding protein